MFAIALYFSHLKRWKDEGKDERKDRQDTEKLAEDILNGKNQTNNWDSNAETHTMPGDPNCPICHGLGYIRQELPVGHPDFGKLQICTCRHAQISQQIHQRLFSLSHLNELNHLTFDNFQPRRRRGYWPAQAESMERASNPAMQFAQSLNGWLLLQGKNGCGKTHLAAAIANQVVNSGVPTLFLTVPDLLDNLRFAYQDPDATFEERFEDVLNSPLLVLDDFGTQNATSWAQEKLFQIVNFRYHQPSASGDNHKFRFTGYRTAHPFPIRRSRSGDQCIHPGARLSQPDR
jgi:DNA replication protein DnaC